MFTMTPKQMDAFSEDTLRRFIKQLAQKLGEPCSEQLAAAGSSDKFEQVIRRGIDQAEQYAIEEQEDVERFLLLALGNGSTFAVDEKLPEVQEILTDEDTDGDDKLAELEAFYAERK